MAGIGFALRKLARRDDLVGVIQGYAHSALAATGPWLFTVLSLGAISVLTAGLATIEEIVLFRLVIIYNFAFSLVATGPIMMVATRFLADMIFLKQVGGAVGLFLGTFMLACAIQLPIVIGFYGFYIDAPLSLRLLGMASFLVISGIWLVSVFLTALKDYTSVTRAFLAGMTLAAAAAIALAGPWGSEGLLLGFTSGLALIFFLLMGRIFTEYPYRVEKPFAFLAYFRSYWDLALAGLVQNVAIWVDKWVMWAAPEAEHHPAGFVAYSFYDSASFLAYLTVVPAVAGFVISVETGFFEKYLRFYRDIQRHATLSRILENQRELTLQVLRGLRNLVVLQGSVCFAFIAFAPRIFEWVRIPMPQLGMFRICVLGSFFHVLVMSLAVVLAYFDLRRAMLGVYIFLLTTNAVFSWATMKLGFAYYGYGYFLSALSTFVLVVLMVAHYMGRLPFLTFVRNNASVQ
jgi:polysaccharide biosynthesis protein PelG